MEGVSSLVTIRNVAAIAGRRGFRAFTLVELLITLAILTIVLSVGIPAYGRFVTESDLSACAADFSGGINQARSEAVLRRVEIRVVPLEGDWTRGFSIHDDGVGADPVRIARCAGSGGRIRVDATDEIQRFDFDGKGRLIGLQNVEFTLCASSGGTGRVLSVSRLGRIETRKQDCGVVP